MLSVGELLAAAATGGAGAKVLDWIYEEYKRRSGAARSAREIVERDLDPLLKAADELVGKIRSLAVQDFQGYRRPSEAAELGVEFAATLFLFAQFWARLEILARESVSVVLSSVKSGEQLQEFVRTLETRRVRLITRARQRGIGAALVAEGERHQVISLYEFYERYQQDDMLGRWIEPLKRILSEARHTSNRQRVLAYGAVVHALIDTLDPEHKVTRLRPGWGNKLTRRSQRAA